MSYEMTYDYYGNLVRAVDPKTATRLADTDYFDSRLPGETAEKPDFPRQGAYEEYNA